MNQLIPRNYCTCAETKDSKGKQILAPSGHSCEYVAARNALIPQAEAYALAKTGHIKGPTSGRKFTHAFATEMDRLAAHL